MTALHRERSRRERRRSLAAVVVLLCAASAQSGCSDVGDSSALPSIGDDAETSADDATTSPADASLEASTDAFLEAAGDSAAEASAEAGESGVDAAVDATGAAAETGARDSGEDSTIPPGVDAAVGPDSQADALADTGTPDAAGIGVSDGGGGLAPCTSAGQTACVQCNGNTDDLCTQTEALFVEFDVAAGLATAPGPESENGCYECLAQGGCLDATVYGYTDDECDDLSGTFAGNTVGGGANQPESSLCLDVVSCILDSGLPVGGAGDCAGTTSGQQYCYCGPGGGSPTTCSGTTSGQNGACFTQETNGFTFAPTDAHDILLNYTVKTQPSGVANKIFACASENGCQQCLE